MKYISLFSGIEAASVAWGPLGWEPIAFCEIDEFPSAVLAHHYPSVPNLGDITKVNWKDVIAKHGRPDVVVGGSPCQSFSIAGGRESLGGESRLMFEYIRACDEIHAPWIVWENVPGVFSVKDGAFQQLLESLQDIGYVSIAWRVLDAQFFGVAQRRRRVFLVGHLGSGGGASAVLFESESVRGNTQTSKQKREELARAAGRGAARGGGESLTLHQNASDDVHVAENQCGTLMASASVSRQQILVDGEGCLAPWDNQSKRIFGTDDAAPTLNRGAGMNTTPSVLQATAIPEAVVHGIYMDATPKITEEVSPTLRRGGDGGTNLAVAFAQNQRGEVRLEGGSFNVITRTENDHTDCAETAAHRLSE